MSDPNGRSLAGSLDGRSSSEPILSRIDAEERFSGEKSIMLSSRLLFHKSAVFGVVKTGVVSMSSHPLVRLDPFMSPAPDDDIILDLII